MSFGEYPINGLAPRRVAYEDDECTCNTCESIRAEDGPSNDNWLNPENYGVSSFVQDMKDAGRGHLV
jgi:hypothetical protein